MPNEPVTPENLGTANPLAARAAGAALAPVETGTVAPNRKVTFSENLGVEGDFTERDLVIPRLNFVQSVGPLSVEHTPGSVLLARQAVLATAAGKEPSKEIELAVIKMSKGYEEVLPYEEMEAAKRFRTEEEVLASGLRLLPTVNEKGEKVKSTARPVGSLVLLVKQPAGVPADLFGTILGEEDGVLPAEYGNYSVAILGVKSTSYSVLRDIFTAAVRLSKERSPRRVTYQKWALTLQRVQIGENWVFVPKLRTNGFYSDAFVSKVMEDFSALI